MSIIGDFFHHKKEVQGRMRQLEALNDIIDQRKAEVIEAGKELDELKSIVADIKALFPEKSEAEALFTYFNALKKRNSELEDENVNLVLEIDSNKRQLADLLEQIKIASKLRDIVLSRRAIEDEMQSLRELKECYFKVEDILFAGYFLSDGATPAFVPLVYFKKIQVSDDEKLYNMALYREMTGKRVAAFHPSLTQAYDCPPGNDLNISLNPLVWITLTDACLAIDSVLYLNGVVSPIEVNQVLQAYLRQYEVVPQGKDLVISRIKRRNQDLS